MTRSQPSLLILALLRFVESENEALAGDLIEEWRRGRSRRWFWRQLLRAVLAASRRQRVSRAAAAMRLVTVPPGRQPDRTLGLIDPATMSLSGIKIRSIGGLGLLSAILLIVIVLPQAGLLVLAGLGGGAVLGVALVMRRRERGLSGPASSAPLKLFDEFADGRPSRPTINGRHTSLERLSAVMA